MKYHFLFLLSAMFIAACSSDGEQRPEYMDSYSIKGLEIPPQLTSPDNSKEMLIPEPSAEALKLLQGNEEFSATGTVSPAFKGLELKTEQGIYWLEVKENADTLWPLMHQFWVHEGIKIVRNEPLLGFMETEWIKEFDVDRDKSFFQTVLNKLSPDIMDKFRLRIERVNGTDTSRIFITHRGLELMVHDDTSRWQLRDSDPLLEREILQRLVLFSGVTKLQAEKIFDGYTPYQTRIRPMEGDDSYEIVGKQEFVWNRVLIALDRIGVEVSGEDKMQGTIDVRVKEVPEELVINKDEVNESSWLVRLFSGAPIEEENAEGVANITIALQPNDLTTIMRLSHNGDSLPYTGLANQFRTALIKLLK